MELTEKLLTELQRRLKIGSRRGVHLNAIPSNSRYKFDLSKLSYIDKALPDNFIDALLKDKPLKFRISWKENVPDLNSLFKDEQIQLVKITKAFENLINQTEAIEAEKGINTFGFGFPILVRRDQTDNKLTVAPVLIWSLKIKRTKEFNTWEITRNDDDPIYLNEILINHLESDSNIKVEPVSDEMLDDGLITKDELIDVCVNLIKSINTSVSNDLEATLDTKLNHVIAIGDKNHYEKLVGNSTNAFIDFAGLFSIFEVQKQNIIHDYEHLMDLKGLSLDMSEMSDHSFQPISSVETDPSQQGILHALESSRNLLIQGPPGTGKSQTLTAILINALENHKRTIVVCEKRTALEVLHKALVEKGLNYHCVLIKDIAKDRRTVVDSVRTRIDRSEYRRYSYSYSKERLDSLINRAKNIITSINSKHQKIGEKLLGDKSWTEVIGNLLSELRNHDGDANLHLQKNPFTYNLQELSDYLALVQRGQKYYSEFRAFETLSFFNPIKFVGDNPYLIEQTIHEDFSYYERQLQEIKNLLQLNKEEYDEQRNNELSSQITTIQTHISDVLSYEQKLAELVKNNKQKYIELRTTELNSQIDNIERVLLDINEIFERNKNNDITNDKKINSFKFIFLLPFSKTKKQINADYKQLKENYASLQSVLENSKDFKDKGIDALGQRTIGNTIVFYKAIQNTKQEFQEKISAEFDSFQFKALLTMNDSLFQNIKRVLSNEYNSEAFKEGLAKIQKSFAELLRNLADSLDALHDTLIQSKDVQYNVTYPDSYEEIKIQLRQIEQRLEGIKRDFNDKIQQEFQDIASFKTNPKDTQLSNISALYSKVVGLTNRIQHDKWTSKTISFTDLPGYIKDVETLIVQKTEYFNADKDIFHIEYNWFQFYNELSEQLKSLVSQLKRYKDWRRSFLIYYLNSLLVQRANIALPTNDSEHKELNDLLGGLGTEQLKYVKEYWYSKQVDKSREFEMNGYLTVENLYNKRSSYRHARLTLRQIVQHNPDLFTTFFPIILTTPDVCCNLFKGMNKYFDIVMFDEASQLRLEDNLPAILKGKQVVIAGDEHQMPPSNYFSKVFDGSIEDEEELDDEEETIKIDRDDILLSCESLLDFGTELSFEKKYLDFHYRSRHPYLIDFSNHAFYNQRLQPLPNNFDYTPIKFISVNGTFSEHTNEAEAEMVLSIIENNIQRLPDGNYPSVGVATFNITQRNLIKSKILERQKFSKYADFNAKIQELEDNGLFIKNLENIQGDERDVIILSCTYGVGKDGKFAQRLGPINHSKGYKLLNVIVTRAKYKVYVCSSIPEQVFMNYNEYLVTEGSNNKRGVLYAYLAYSKAISEGNNDARIAVLTDLKENSKTGTPINPSFGQLESPFEEEVYQVLADEFGEDKLIPQLQFAGFRIDIVFDYKKTGAPKIAIECDGAKYHTSREAYLHDIYRQKILEGHGFVFHRIWSTNWWRNAKREANQLINFIKNGESIIAKKISDEASTVNAFTDKIEVSIHPSKLTLFDDANEVATIKSFQTFEAPIIKQTNPNAIRMFSKVKIRYVNNGKDMNILIGDSYQKNEVNNNIQKLNYKSPLAASILGHSVGDIVKVGDLDNFVEIVEVVN